MPATGPARSGFGQLNASAILVRNTHSFQAPDFYARLGYTECGRTPGYPNGYDHIHLVKRLL